jgi:hypothetical protein
MKQAITQKQYEELPPAARAKYIAWAVTKAQASGNYAEAYRSIGHLIWFLDDHNLVAGDWYNAGLLCKQARRFRQAEEWEVYPNGVAGTVYEAKELVDALWMAVKAVLAAED